MKKLILPISLFACLIFLATPFTAYAFLDDLFGSKQSSSEIDCLKEMENMSWKLSHPEWYYDKTKQTITKKDTDYCDVAFNAMWEGELRQKDHVRITYFSNKDDAVKKLKSLTSSGTYHLFKSDNNTYLAVGYADIKTIMPPPGIIRDIEYELVAPVYYQVGQVAGSCLFEYKQSQHVGVGLENNSESNVPWYINNQASIAYEVIINQGEQEIKTKMDGKEVTGFVRSVTDVLFKDTPLKNLCGSDIQVTQISSKESYDAYQKPKKEGEQVKSPEEIPPKQSQSNQTQQQAEQPAQQNTPSQDGNLFNISGLNPLEIWRNIQELLNIQEGIISLVQSSSILTESEEILLAIPKPSIAFDPEGKPWNFLPGFIPYENIEPDSTVRVTERTRLSDKNNQTYLELRPGQSSKAVLKIPGKNDGNLLFLEEGEIEVVKNKSGVSDSLYDGIKTPNGTVVSVETHYLVSYDKKKNQTTVVVYEGKVEVKTNDGKTTTVSPNGNKPGVIVVSQKFSVIKLAIVGLLLTGTIVGITWFLKRKHSEKRSK
ncbi:MAG: hypothetical protein Q7R97_01215 [Candidatus Daviesbacteria bacterium]|nr:hypothetical protein [Candidatus Daviesbacteria bacterium]